MRYAHLRTNLTCEHCPLRNTQPAQGCRQHAPGIRERLDGAVIFLFFSRLTHRTTSTGLLLLLVFALPLLLSPCARGCQYNANELRVG